MLFEALILGIIVGKIRGGQLKRLGYFSMRFPLLLLVSFIVMLATSILISMGNPIAIQHRMKLYILAYCILFILLFFNLHNKSLWFVLIGAIANFAAIVLNQGSMPVDMVILEKMNFQNMLLSINSGTLQNFMPLTEAYPLTEYLGKRWIIPFNYPLRQIFSVGDAFIAIGLFFFIQSVMHSKIYRKASSVIRFDHHARVR